MVRAKKKPQNVLSTTEVANVQEEKRELEGVLQESENAGAGTQAEQIDKSRIKSQIRRLDLCLEQSAPGKLTGSQKDALSKRETELEDILKVGIPTYDEMQHPAKNPGAVRKHMHWGAKNKQNIKEYRNVQRLLRPGEEKSIEQLRKEK
jgi:hypothetical protein